MTITTFAAFALMCLLNAVVPGPNLLIVLRAQTSAGPAAARATIAGIASVQLLWGTAAVTGAAVMFAQGPLLFVVMKLIGAIYICTMGFRMLVGGMSRPSGPDDALPTTGRIRHAAQGALSCLFNPNVLLFYLAVFPQFLAGSDSTPGVGVLLVMSSALVSASWLTFVSFVLERRGRGGAGLGPWASRGLGVGMVGFGAMLAARL